MNKWTYDPEEEDDEQKEEKFWDRGKSKKPIEFRPEDNPKYNKPPRKLDEEDAA